MASEHLIKITNKAKQLRRANPKLKWMDAVKKASKLLRPAAKKAAPKKAAKKKPHTKWKVIPKHERRVSGKVPKKYTEDQLYKIANDYAYTQGADLDKVTARLFYHPELVTMYLQKIKEYEKKSGTKISGTKKPVTKTHKDTKSHNVNIRVVSGMRDLVKNTNSLGQNAIRVRQAMETDIKNLLNQISNIKSGLYPVKNITEKRKLISQKTNELKYRKKALADQQKIINQYLK